jgi:hypothetical protein
MTTGRTAAISLVLVASSFSLVAPRSLEVVEAQGPHRTRTRVAFGVGQPVQVLWGAQWYDATVLSVDADGSYRIRYEGWSEMWNEPVPPDRIRPRGGVALPPPPPPSPVARPREINLVENGGFEQPAVARNGWTVFPEIPGWFLASGPGFEIQAGVAGAPFEGRQLLELDSHAPTSIGQDLRTRAGREYALSVAVSPRPGTPAADNRVGIYWDGALVARVEADGSRLSSTAWQVVTVMVRARGSRARLEIRDEGTPNSLGGFVDDVRVVEVAPPPRSRRR